MRCRSYGRWRWFHRSGRRVAFLALAKGLKKVIAIVIVLVAAQKIIVVKFIEIGALFTCVKVRKGKPGVAPITDSASSVSTCCPTSKFIPTITLGFDRGRRWFYRSRSRTDSRRWCRINGCGRRFYWSRRSAVQ